MRVSVVCCDTILLAGIYSLLGGVPGVRVERTDGTLLATSRCAVQGGIDAVVLAGGELSPEEFAHFSHLKAKHGFRIVAVSHLADAAQSPEKSVADALVFRDNGAQGLHRAIGLLMKQASLAGVAPTGHPPVANRPSRLTRRERDVALLVAKGKSNRQVADLLGLREQSVKNLVSVIMRKLDCENRVQVALQFTAEPTKIAG